MAEVVFAVICFLARVLDPRSRSILSGDGAPKGGPERRRLTRNVLEVDRVGS
jgi:hypothetical protein